MAKLIYFTVLFSGMLCPTLIAGAEDQSSLTLVRVPRGFKKRVCRKYGICEGQGGGHGGWQGGYQGGYSGYQGYPPTINIGISQSQSSSSAGGGANANGYYPNNYQYNHAHPGYGGYDGYHNKRPGFLGNSNGGYNNQFNGNYYAPSGITQGGYGGFGNGFRPYDEQDGGVDHKPEFDDVHNDAPIDNHDNYPQNYGAHQHGSYVGAYAGTYSNAGRSAKD